MRNVLVVVAFFFWCHAWELIDSQKASNTHLLRHTTYLWLVSIRSNLAVCDGSFHWVFCVPFASLYFLLNFTCSTVLKIHIVTMTFSSKRLNAWHFKLALDCRNWWATCIPYNVRSYKYNLLTWIHSLSIFNSFGI